jgi:hypothetical protein
MKYTDWKLPALTVSEFQLFPPFIDLNKAALSPHTKTVVESGAATDLRFFDVIEVLIHPYSPVVVLYNSPWSPTIKPVF